MIVLRAEELGMCFGVRDALQALADVEQPAEVTIHGELVHNPEVLRQLDRRGFHRMPEQQRRMADTKTVLVTAHGISERERTRLRAAGKQLIDTTCPLVHRAHHAAAALAADGRRVIVLGRRDHVEVRGITEDLVDPIVVHDSGDVQRWPERRFGVLCQTTMPTDHARELLAAIAAANPDADVRFVDTICSPTKARIAAVEALLLRVDALVVVGGRNSNNTRQLTRRAETAGVPALQVENEKQLDPAFLHGRRCVGLTAGTSTLPATVDAVEAALRAIATSTSVTQPSG